MSESTKTIQESPGKRHKITNTQNKGKHKQRIPFAHKINYQGKKQTEDPCIYIVNLLPLINK